MIRLIAFVVVLSLAGATPGLAGDTLLESGTRAAMALCRTGATRSTSSVEGTRPAVGVQRALIQPSEPGLEASGLRKRTKVMIAIGAAVAFAAVAYAIDHRVVDNTPSSLGSRKD